MQRLLAIVSDLDELITRSALFEKWL